MMNVVKCAEILVNNGRLTMCIKNLCNTEANCCQVIKLSVASQAVNIKK